MDKKVEYHHGEHDKPYLGIILEINSTNYFVPLSSPKPKHNRMSENITFKKIEKKGHLFAVLNINNMIPVPLNLCKEIDIGNISDTHYKLLLNQEYFICKKKEKEIMRSAKMVHKFICDEPKDHEKMLEYCCDFIALEHYCKSRV
ncbi:type III toxin-antitoxin system ToxN/AbiQ family toxin [Levilactobacillus parabrevis]|nr:type III toxin-antitoxin system ToxN/AbiQ family toxin [Levilactobacillus parabrevis]